MPAPRSRDLASTLFLAAALAALPALAGCGEEPVTAPAGPSSAPSATPAAAAEPAAASPLATWIVYTLPG